MIQQSLDGESGESRASAAEHRRAQGIGQPADRNVWVAILAGMLGGFMAILDIQVVNASLNEMVGTLSAARDEASWISTSYLVAEIIVIPITPLLSRIFGLRTYMVGASLLFLLCSTLCGFA